jgi:pimeloyl-ACP methyl ester carboxylesterase
MMTSALEFRSLRGLVPALFYRLVRCDRDDAEFFHAVAERILNRDESWRSAGDLPYSNALNNTIMLSEVISVRNDAEEIREAGSDALFGWTGGVLARLNGDAAWPIYETDEWFGEFAQTDARILILHGTFDSITPVSFGRNLAKHYPARQRLYVELPHAGHGAASSSHEIEEDLTCGGYIQRQFLNDPRGDIDTSCVDEVPPFEFTTWDDVLLEIAGHTEVWDNPP